MTALQGMRVAGLLVAGALAMAAQGPAKAQDLQAGKPIRLIVGLSPGGGTDVTARLIAQQMTANTGMTVLVENKAGGNFIPALMEVARAAPDGHTLYFSSTSSLITQALNPDYPYDLRKFTAISEVATGPLILVVRNDLGVKSVKDLIALAKQKPGTIRFGLGGGIGSSLGVSTALLQTLADIKINMVPYRGAAPALNDLLGGHIDAMIDAMPVMSVQAKEGKVTPLAVTGTKRSASLPDVPTMQELGFPTFVVTGWYGMFAPPGTPASIAQKLRDDAAKAIAPKEVVETLAKQGMEPRGTQPAEYAKYMEQEFAFYSKIIKDARHQAAAVAISALRSRACPDRARLFDCGHNGCPAHRRAKRRRPSHGYRRAFRYNRLIIRRNRNALSRSLDRPFRRQLSLVKRHAHPQGHGALRRRVAGGDGPLLREAARTPGRG